MHVSAKADYAVRALVELTAMTAVQPGYVTVEQLAGRQGLPVKFLETIFTELRKDGVVISRRGVDGGYRLARGAGTVTVADIIRAVDGPLAAVRGLRPEDTEYGGAATALPQVWVALRAAVRSVLEGVTLADLVSGDLPSDVSALTAPAAAWHRR
ncbi:MAG TPA: Rrf2 family transcriptional regulator [Actinomycetes bacterium]